MCEEDFFLARFVSNEFVVVTPPSALPDLGRESARRIQDLFTRLFIVDGIELVVRACIGFVSFPDHGDSVDVLLKNGEAAVYEARRAGPRQLVQYDNTFHTRLQRHFTLESLLHNLSMGNFEEDGFRLHYQPICQCKTGKMLAVEALLRWNIKDLPETTPDEFIPILEETNMIVPVGAWALKRACRQVMAWRKDEFPDLRLSVNISAVQFLRGDLELAVKEALEDSGLPPSQLCLELTESMLLNVDTQFVRDSMQSLVDLGISLSLDDFGTGYSSLSYLARLPVSELKIDRSFVDRIHTGKNDAAVVNTIIAIAHELNLHVVAEGVETQEQYEYLVNSGCTALQGIFIGRAQSPVELVMNSRVCKCNKSDGDS